MAIFKGTFQDQYDMNRWIFSLSIPLLLLLVMPIDAQAERLLLTGDGEMQKKFTTTDSDFEMVFHFTQTEKRTFLELEGGFITYNGEQHFMHPETMLRDFHNHDKIRLAGSFDNGDLFLIYGDRDGSNYEMFGKIFTPENKFRVQYDGVIQSLDIAPKTSVSNPDAIVEYTPTLGIDFVTEDPQFIQRDMMVTVNAFDANKSDGGIRNYSDTLEGVKIKVTLEQNKKQVIVVDDHNAFEEIIPDEWIEIHSMEGQTNKNGISSLNKLLTSGVFEPKQWMRVTITAMYGDQTVTEQFKVWVTEVGAK